MGKTGTKDSLVGEFLQFLFYERVCFFSEGRPSRSFLSNYTIAYFAKTWPYRVVTVGSEQHKVQLAILLQSDGYTPALAPLLYTFFNHYLCFCLFVCFCTHTLVHILDPGLVPSLNASCQLPGWCCFPSHQQKQGVWN